WECQRPSPSPVARLAKLVCLRRFHREPGLSAPRSRRPCPVRRRSCRRPRGHTWWVDRPTQHSQDREFAPPRLVTWLPA
ncbi:FRQ1, partial [Symbiodinium sp. CCMP2592]